MAIPSFVAASAGATDAGGTWSYTGTGAGAAGRLMLVQVEQCGATSSGAITVTSVTNIEDLSGTDNLMTELDATGYPTGSVGAAAGYQYVFLGRSLNTTAPVITGGGSTSDDIYVRMYEFQNASTGTTLATVVENVSAGGVVNGAGAVAAVTDSSVTTRGPNRLALNLICADNDNTIGALTGQTGGTWAELVAEYSSSTGTDGMLSLQGADMVAPGTIDGGSVSMGGTPNGNANWGNIGFALIGSGELVSGIVAPGFASLDAVQRKSVW